MGWGGHDHWTWGITEGCGRVVPSPLYLLGRGVGGGLDMTCGITEGCAGWFPVHCTYLGGGGGGLDMTWRITEGCGPVVMYVGHNVLGCRNDIIIRGNAGSTVLI